MSSTAKRIMSAALAFGLVAALIPAMPLLNAGHQAQAEEQAQDAQNTITRVTLSPMEYTYDGTEKRPVPTVYCGDKVLTKDVDYTVEYRNNINASSLASVDIKGIGNYTGAKREYFTIAKAEITSAAISEKESTFDGTVKKPVITVKCGEKTLVPYDNKTYQGDYQVHGPISMTAAGNKTFTIYGTNNYTGTQVVTYVIHPASIESATVTLSQTKYAYDGNWKEPEITVTMGGRTLYFPRDYTISYPAEGGITVGKKTLGINGVGNYTGHTQATYEIVSAASGNNGGSGSGSGGNNGSGGSGSGSNGGSGNNASIVTMYRLYNPNTGEHLFTADANERDTLVSLGWKYEGEAWNAPKAGGAVYRLYNPNTGEHHYTTDKNEYDTLRPVGWNGEGVFFYSDLSKGTPVYRLFNSHASSFTHHYTTDANEYKVLKTRGWTDESIGWYGLK